MPEDAAQLREVLRRHALSLPEAWLDHPWEDDAVVKVRKKIFVFLGAEGSDPPGVSLKLPASRDEALATVSGAHPTAYGLGKAGWVSLPLTEAPPEDVLLEWVEESYRAVAPKRLAALLQEQARSL